MPTPRLVSKRLREMLGTEAAETMVDWLDALEVHHEENRRAMRAEIAELRGEMTSLRSEIRDGFAEMRVGFAAVDAKLAQRNADLMKWMIGFWLASFGGIIGAILALGRVGR